MKYIFRGASKENPNEWIYGRLVLDFMIYDKNNCSMAVDPNSVGLASSAVDMEGITIFENDILKDLRNNNYYKVIFNGLDFWLEIVGADMPYMLLKDIDTNTCQVVGNSYEVKEC